MTDARSTSEERPGEEKPGKGRRNIRILGALWPYLRPYRPVLALAFLALSAKALLVARPCSQVETRSWLALSYEFVLALLCVPYFEHIVRDTVWSHTFFSKLPDGGTRRITGEPVHSRG